MFEHITYETLLERMLARVRESEPELDTREGSLIYSALAPAAAELQTMYIGLDTVLAESFADTQSRPFLARRAAERGVMVKEGTKARRLGEFNLDIPLASRFALNGLYYTALSRLAAGRFVMECETPGVCGHADSGTLVPCDYIPGLNSAALTDIITHGADAESTEQLRKRYFRSLESLAFGGNIADYIQKTGALPGVGGVKVTPAWNGGGTVLLTITDSASNAPTTELIAEVQAAIDPRSGGGQGVAPIGHFVTVRGAAETVIDLSATFVFFPGYDWLSVKNDAELAVREYIADLRERWAYEDATVVRISGLEQRLLAVPGILDLTGTKLNGAASNLTLPSGNIPVFGSVTAL